MADIPISGVTDGTPAQSTDLLPIARAGGQAHVTAQSIADLTSLPSSFPIASVTLLQATLDGKAALVHTHAIESVTALQTTLDSKASLFHTHAIASVVLLQTTLDGKAALVHTHAVESVTFAADSRLLGRAAGSAGAGQEITVGAGLALAAGALTATGGGGASGQLIVPFQCNAAAALTLTNQANAEQFLGNSNRNITRADLTGYTQYRLVARVVTGSASVNSPRLYAQFHTAFTTTVATFSPLGSGGDVALSLTTAGHIETPWTDLAAGAIADVFLTVMQHGGDAAADPALGPVALHFR